MADIEKVKTGIFEMLQRNTWKDIDDKRHRFQPVLNDALALLKEQQSKKPIYDCPLIRCPRCRNSIDMKQKYCDECGQAIDWKDGEQE